MLVAGGLLVGCSGSTEKKEYDIPKSLCGISVERDLISVFLPSGKEIDVQEKNPVPSRKRCQVNVDGKLVLIASQEWWPREKQISEVADAHPQLKSAELPEDGTYIYSSTGAMGQVKSCANQDHPEHTLYTAMQVYASDQAEDSAMKELIMAYTKAVENSDECQ
ncbi:hypothetical protein [Streptomyces sp. NPDC127197]|uniref:hypothetical protein n=1 Tax=Streptomyces sp. NPDC127197 TaxID=3345388 RepID=UPI00363199B0